MSVQVSKPDWIKQLEKAVGEIPTAPGQGLVAGLARNPGRTAAEIKTVCCVCGTHVSGDSRAPLVSHGYCQPCGAQALAAIKGQKKSNPQLQLLMNGQHQAQACFNCGHALTPDQDVCPVCWAGQTDENPCGTRHGTRSNGPGLAQLTGAEQRSLNDGFKKFHGIDGHKTQTWGCPGSKHYKLWLCGRCPGVSWGHGLGETCDGCSEQSMTVEKSCHEWTGHRVVFSGEARPYLCVDLEARQLVLVKGDLGKLERHGELGPTPLIEYVAPKGSSKGPYHYIHATKLGFEPSLVCDQDLGGYRYVGGVYSVEDWLHD